MGCKAHGRELSRALEDPSNLGGRSMDAVGPQLLP